MITIRKYDKYRYTVITPKPWGSNVSPPLPVLDAINESIGTFPKVLSPPQNLGESKQRELLLLRLLPPTKNICEVQNCNEFALLQGVTKKGIIFTVFHNLCPCCFVVWVQEFTGSKL